MKNFQAKYGTQPRIQLNDSFATLGDIGEFVSSERQSLSESERPKMIVSLKVDRDVKMGIVTDVKQELRKASALKINYAATEAEQVY